MKDLEYKLALELEQLDSATFSFWDVASRDYEMGWKKFRTFTKTRTFLAPEYEVPYKAVVDCLESSKGELEDLIRCSNEKYPEQVSVGSQFIVWGVASALVGAALGGFFYMKTGNVAQIPGLAIAYAVVGLVVAFASGVVTVPMRIEEYNIEFNQFGEKIKGVFMDSYSPNNVS